MCFKPPTKLITNNTIYFTKKLVCINVFFQKYTQYKLKLNTTTGFTNRMERK